MSDTKTFDAVVTIIQDRHESVYGLYDLLEVQKNLLFRAIDREDDISSYTCHPIVQRVLYMMRIDKVEMIYNKKRDKDYQKVKDIILNKDQIVVLDRKNWPRYPVLACTIYTHYG